MDNNDALIATTSGNLKLLKELLGKGYDVNAKYIDGQTLLHHAANEGRHEVVKFLMKNGADILKTDDNNENYTALHIAVTKSDKATTSVILKKVGRGILRKLLDSKIKSNGYSALHIAVENDDYTHVSLLLKYGAIFDLTNDADKTPMDLAKSEQIRGLFELISVCFANAKKNDEVLIDALKKCIIQDFTSAVNCKNREGRSIMQELISNMDDQKLTLELLDLQSKNYARDETSIVKYDRERKSKFGALGKLLEQCQDFWFENSEIAVSCADSISEYQRKYESKYAPTELGEMCDDFKKACCNAMILGHKILLAYREFSGKTYIADPRMKIIEEILEAFGFDTEKILTTDGKEACYFTMLPTKWKKEVTALLYVLEDLLYMSVENFADQHNSAQLIHAVTSEDLEEVQRLLQNSNLSIDYCDKEDGRTALCYAAEIGNRKIIRELLNAGAKVNQEDNTMISPVYLAASKGHVKVVKLLLKNVVNTTELKEFIDRRWKFDNNSTALHAAAKVGCVDIVKILLKYGATCEIVDDQDRRPLDVASSDDVREFLQTVDECFRDAEAANVVIVHKLKAMEIRDFLATIRARNRNGMTVDEVAAKAEAKNVAVVLTRMIEKAQQDQ